MDWDYILQYFTDRRCVSLWSCFRPLPQRLECVRPKNVTVYVTHTDYYFFVVVSTIRLGYQPLCLERHLEPRYPTEEEGRDHGGEEGEGVWITSVWGPRRPGRVCSREGPDSTTAMTLVRGGSSVQVGGQGFPATVTTTTWTVTQGPLYLFFPSSPSICPFYMFPFPFIFLLLPLLLSLYFFSLIGFFPCVS